MAIDSTRLNPLFIRFIEMDRRIVVLKEDHRSTRAWGCAGPLASNGWENLLFDVLEVGVVTIVPFFLYFEERLA